jgi:hypothetical protein
MPTATGGAVATAIGRSNYRGPGRTDGQRTIAEAKRGHVRRQPKDEQEDSCTT